MSIFRPYTSETFAPVMYDGQMYNVHQEGTHFTMIGENGHLISFDWYSANCGHVVENVEGTTESNARDIVYLLWFQC